MPAMCSEGTTRPRKSAAEFMPFAGARGDRFLAFLIDRLRPALAEQYPMADDHALFGHSAGGALTGYAMFARPGGFDRYIIGIARYSPGARAAPLTEEMVRHGYTDEQIRGILGENFLRVFREVRG